MSPSGTGLTRLLRTSSLLLDEGLGLEDVGFALGDGRLGVEDLERGQSPDLDLLLVLRQEVAGQLERLLA